MVGIFCCCLRMDCILRWTWLDVVEEAEWLLKKSRKFLLQQWPTSLWIKPSAFIFLIVWSLDFSHGLQSLLLLYRGFEHGSPGACLHPANPLHRQHRHVVDPHQGHAVALGPGFFFCTAFVEGGIVEFDFSRSRPSLLFWNLCFCVSSHKRGDRLVEINGELCSANKRIRLGSWKRLLLLVSATLK